MGLISNGTTLLDAGSISAAKGSLTLIKTLTASSSATLSFVDGASSVVLDSTYKEYIFRFYNIHPQTDNQAFQVNFRDGSTAYDATKTTTFFEAVHSESDDSELAYIAANDVAQGTGVHTLTRGTGNDNDEASSVYLRLFNPSSTTFVKHFMAVIADSNNNGQISQEFSAGYCNVTAAIDGVQFSFASGNIDAGTIKLYGVT